MKFKKFGRLAFAVAATGVLIAAPLISGCNTSHPTAEITISYKDVEYVLKYKMYRNMYPQTVQHFIELADNGFYDNMIIHDYTSSNWYTGGYTYNGETYASAIDGGTEELVDYMEDNSKEKAYSELTYLTSSVYENYIDGVYPEDSALNTLIGEFSSNQHTIENGALSKSFGCLSMYYTTKSGDAVDNKKVYLKKTGSDPGVQGEYNYNSATSLFSIQSGTSTSTDSTHCIFAVLQNTDVLTDLKDDISTSKLTTSSVTLYVDNYDKFLGANVNEDTFTVPDTPIIIKTVKITKY